MKFTAAAIVTGLMAIASAAPAQQGAQDDRNGMFSLRIEGHGLDHGFDGMRLQIRGDIKRGLNFVTLSSPSSFPLNEFFLDGRGALGWNVGSTVLSAGFERDNIRDPTVVPVMFGTNQRFNFDVANGFSFDRKGKLSWRGEDDKFNLCEYRDSDGYTYNAIHFARKHGAWLKPGCHKVDIRKVW